MSRQLTLQEIEATAVALISAEQTNLGVEVSMPVVYPDGRAVTVVVTFESGGYLVHDAGLGTMYLTSTGVQFSKQVRKRLASLASTYGCEFLDGRMMRRASMDDMSLAIAMVANASRCVGDEALAARRRSESEFVTAVTESLREVIGANRVRTNEECIGESGAKYRVHNIILDRSKSDAIAFVEPLASRAVVSQRFMEFTDLKPVNRTANMYVVADDQEMPSGPHQKLLERVCTLVAYHGSKEKFQPFAA